GLTSDVTNRSFTGSSDTAPPGHQSPPPAPGGTPATRTGETPRPETFGRTRFLHFPKHESHVRPKPSQRPLFKCPPSNLSFEEGLGGHRLPPPPPTPSGSWLSGNAWARAVVQRS